MEQPSGHAENADQIAYWNGPSGQRWADRHAAQESLLGPIADVLIDRAKPKVSAKPIPLLQNSNERAKKPPTWTEVWDGIGQ
ncbi:hypothetical protein ABIB81_009376, partial [Bradyrhizobium sp. I1.7.5]